MSYRVGQESSYAEHTYCAARLSHSPIMLGFQDMNKVVDTLSVLVVKLAARSAQESPLLVSWSVHALGTQVVLDTVQSSEPVAV